jgi:hypothetical protein
MEPVKSFNNIIIGQFALTGAPVKVYVNSRFLIITSVDDIEDPLVGFGMDENGQMVSFDYRNVEKLSVSGNEVTLDMYNQGMGAKDSGEEDVKDAADSEKDTKEESLNVLEITRDVFNAKMRAIDAEKDALKDKETELKKQPITDNVNEDHNYTFGTGDIVKNKNTSCPHHGSMGIVQKVMDIPMKGLVAVYRVTNSGDTYKPGDVLTKTVDQLEPVEDIDEKLVYYKDKKDRLRRFDTDKSANKKYEK